MYKWIFENFLQVIFEWVAKDFKNLVIFVLVMVMVGKVISDTPFSPWKDNEGNTAAAILTEENKRFLKERIRLASIQSDFDSTVIFFVLEYTKDNNWRVLWNTQIYTATKLGLSVGSTLNPITGQGILPALKSEKCLIISQSPEAPTEHDIAQIKIDFIGSPIIKDGSVIGLLVLGGSPPLIECADKACKYIHAKAAYKLAHVYAALAHLSNTMVINVSK